MDSSLNNASVASRIELCEAELEKIENLLVGMGVTSHPAPFLIRYAIMRSCGAIEYGFKTIISDIHEKSQTTQVRNFIDKKFRNSSMNPSMSNICSSLGSFDDEWKKQFKEGLHILPNRERVINSLNALNEARNQFAHGGAPNMSFDSLKVYFQDCLQILALIETAVESS